MSADRLDQIDERLCGIEKQLEKLELVLQREAELRAQLGESEDSRRQLADQATHLIDLLGEARRELRRHWDAEQQKGES